MHTDKVITLVGDDFYECLSGVAKRNELEVYLPAIKIIGNLAVYSDEHVRGMLRAGVLQQMITMIRSSMVKVKYEVLFALSNFVSSGEDVIKAVLES